MGEEKPQYPQYGPPPGYGPPPAPPAPAVAPAGVKSFFPISNDRFFRV